MTLMFVTWIAYSQDVGYNEINGNNIKTSLLANGSLFKGDGVSFSNFIVPFDDNQMEISTIFTAGIWMGGIDPDESISTAYITYPSSISAQYIPGPINSGELEVDLNKVWKVTRTEIEAHILDFQDGIIDGPLSDGIEQWPANGNIFYTPSLPIDQELAPYFDADTNGIYNPDKGDYPIIGNDLANVIPEQILFTIFNTNSFYFSLEVEIHAMMYALNCDENEALQNTIFTRHKIINKSPITYRDFKLSYWQDPALGCYIDDFIGCDTTLNAFFTYNKNELDGDANGDCPGGTSTFNNNPPVHSTLLLNQKMESLLVTYNGSVGSMPEETADPANNQQYYLNMSAKFRDGTPMTVGGIGFDKTSTDFTNYAFHDDPNDPNGWSMSPDSIEYADPRALANTGIESFQPGQVHTLDIAHIYTNDLASNNLENVTNAKADIQSIQAVYDGKFEGPCTFTTNTNQIELDHIKVYPNPSTGTFYISQAGEFDSYMLTDNLGRIITTGSVNIDLTQVKVSVAKGTYILKLEHKETSEQLQKTLIVQ